MTIEVVGDKPEVTKEVVCARCGYRLRFTGEDVQYKSNSEGDVIAAIVCPREKCGARNLVTWP